MKLSSFGSFSRSLMIGVLAVLSAALAFSATTAYADHHLKAIARCTTITESGSYVVTRVITATVDDLQPLGTNSAACIVVAADFVTLDLTGYTIAGPGGAVAPGMAAVGIFSNRRGISVRNGVVTNFTHGLLLTGSGITVEHIRALNNAFFGIFVSPGNGHRVVGNTANDNNLNGITVGCPAVVLHNVAAGNANNIDANPLTCTRLGNNPLP